MWLKGAMAAWALALALAGMAAAQSTVPMQGLRADPEAPIRIEADSLSVSQADGSAVFRGNVLIGQGDLRLAAAEVRVDYTGAEGGSRGRIRLLTATGGVTLASGSEQAESREAVYDVEAGVVTLTGDVLVTQGPNLISGQRLVVSLKDGTGTMEGRVRTVIDPAAGGGEDGAD